MKKIEVIQVFLLLYFTIYDLREVYNIKEILRIIEQKIKPNGIN